MKKYFLRKCIHLIPTLIGLSFFAFILIRLVPGDPVMVMLGERGADPSVYLDMQKKLGLDKPIYEQYFKFVFNALQFDFGPSIVSKRPVIEEFTDRFTATLELGILAMFWALLIGIPMGIIAAIKRNSFWDYFLMSGSLIGYSMPIFWWALILIIVFSVKLGITPVSGRISPFFEIEHVTGFMLIDSWFSMSPVKAFNSAFRHLILPSLAMGTIPLAAMARMTRSSLLEVLSEDYIRTAKAKGLPKWKVVFKHALKNALMPIITVAGLLFGSIITGAILTETIFSWPGIGKWIVASVSARDYPVIQGGIMMIGILIVFLNIFIDLTYALIDPKTRDSISKA